jgi:hypothetical protein
VWSWYGGGYCVFTPTDGGPDPDAGRGIKELMCFPTGVWSSCGSPYFPGVVYDCEGPGHDGTQGNGAWVETKFNLANFIGQRFRIRWIAQSWDFGGPGSYQEYGGTWANRLGDDGWWIDDISLAGVITEPLLPVADADVTVPEACPEDACLPGQGSDNGFDMSIAVVDTDGDGLILAGERITISAALTDPVGGCVDGATQFRFFKDGALVQQWSNAPGFPDNPVRHATYQVQARCSVFPACTSTPDSTADNTISIFVYRGDAEEIVVDARHDASGPLTTLEWESVHQPLALEDGYDVITGAFSAAGDPNLDTLFGAGCLGSRVGQVEPAPGSPVSTTDAGADPSLVCSVTKTQACTVDADCPGVETCTGGQVVYYIVGYAHPTGTGTAVLLGRKGDGTLRTELPICP